MKFTALFLTAAFILSAVWTTVTHVAVSPTRQFTEKQLSPQQIAACSEFKASTIQPRHSQLERVQKLGILPDAPLIEENIVLNRAKVALHAVFPWLGSATTHVTCDYGHPTFMMTRKDVINLLGEPSSSNTSSLQYNIGFLDGSYHIFIVRLHSGHVVGTGGVEIQ